MTKEIKDRIAAGRLRRALAGQEADPPSRGYLIERDEVVRILSRSLPSPGSQQGRPASKRGVSFHFALTHVGAARQRDPDRLPSDRAWAFPRRSEVDAVRALGGRYDRTYQAWYLPSSKAAAAARFSTVQARDLWARGGTTGVRGVVAAANFQRYIERADLDEPERHTQVVHDSDGAVSFGSIGEDADERTRFWTVYADAASRANARLQSRMIIEVPHEVAYAPSGPARIRQLAQAIVGPLRERSLPYHVTAHWPEIDKGTDSRNVHLHVVYGERVTERLSPGEWRIGRPDRSARGDGAGGGAWTAGLRDRYSSALNDALADIGASKRYDPRSYAESGITSVPGQHLGSARWRLNRQTLCASECGHEPELSVEPRKDALGVSPALKDAFLVGPGTLTEDEARRRARRMTQRALAYSLRMTRAVASEHSAVANHAHRGIAILAAALRRLQQQQER